MSILNTDLVSYTSNKKISKFQLAIIMALVIILSISALVIAVLHSEYSATMVQASRIQQTVSTQSKCRRCWMRLMIKY